MLEDGRVQMLARDPGVRVIKSGPTWDEMMFVRLEDLQGEGIAGIVHWAAHACTVAGSRVSADFPGELCRRLGERFELLSFIGRGRAGTDLNPPYRKMTREEMLDNVDRLMCDIPAIAWQDLQQARLFGVAGTVLRLAYGPIPTADELRATKTAMCQIAETGVGLPEAIATLADILNTEPGQALTPSMTATSPPRWPSGARCSSTKAATRASTAATCR